MLQGATLADANIDAVALKPSEVDVGRASGLDVRTVAVDYEGHDHVPPTAELAALDDETNVRVTTPVRADGYDPLGDRSQIAALPDSVGRVLVAGHPAYLSESERERAIAPRLRAGAATCPDPWVGTEGIERLALAVGGTQFELLGPDMVRRVRALRAGGYRGEVSVYAPTVLADDEAAILNALGEYVARRGPVSERLPDRGTTDAGATGRAREVLSEAVREYGLVGDAAGVAERVNALRDAGVDTVVGYPARGLDPIL